MAWQISDGRLERLIVFIDIEGRPIPIGELSFEGRSRKRATFRYARSWAERRNHIVPSPVGIPYKTKGILSDPHEVHLPFADAAADGWGRGVLQRAFPNQKFGMAEFIAAAADTRTGWFRFGHDPAAGPEQWIPDMGTIMIDDEPSVDDLARAAEAVDRGDETTTSLMMLYRSSTDVGGARPKARVKYEGRDWIAKFPAWGDTFNEPRAEALCLSLAEACGIETPRHQILELQGRAVLLVERFDRTANGGRLGYISAGTLVGSDMSTFSTNISYLDIAHNARKAGIKPCAGEIFKRALFNALIHNTDDHLRNLGFIGNTSSWRISPVFDILPQRADKMVLGIVPKADHLPDPVRIAAAWQSFSITKIEAEEIFNSLAVGCQQCLPLMDKYAVGGEDRSRIASLMNGAIEFPPLKP